MRRILCALVLLTPQFAHAQTDDRDYLTAFLEDSLSGAGRKVTVTGFSGALSSQATVQELTIADDQGVWLTLQNVALDWSRSSLLQGAVEVEKLTADEIILDRLPISETGTSPEASSFSLPELPVSVNIGEISAKHIVLGSPVLGTPVEATLTAAMNLSGGEGKISLQLERTDDGPKGMLDLSASYANLTQRLTIDLRAEEGAGGIASIKLGLPGAPSVALTVVGEGPVTDFAADVALRTDGVDRLAGKVKLTGKEDGATRFAADLSGDLAPLFLPQYAEFFGNRVALVASGQRWPDGRLALDQMNLSASALQLQGALSLAADGLPRSFQLSGEIAAADGSPVVLPLTSDMPVKISRASIALGYDADKDEGWTGDIAVTGFDRTDFRAANIVISGSGRIARVNGAQQVGGTIKFSGEGLDPSDAALAQALGSVVWGGGSGYWREGNGSFNVQQLNMVGEDYTAEADGKIEGLGDAFAMTGKVTAKMEDLSRLSAIAGRPLAGSAQLELSGTGSLITSAFDVDASAIGTDMRGGVAQLDNLLRGEASLTASAKRDETGTNLRSLTIAAATLRATANGRLESKGSDITAEVQFDDLRNLGGGYRGRLSGTAHVTGTLQDATLTLDADANGLGVGQTEADLLLAGPSKLTLGLVLKDGAVTVQSATLNNPQVLANATGRLDGTAQRLDLDARLMNLALLLPDFPGPLTISGTALQDTNGLQVDLAGRGPGQIDATVKGLIAPGYASGDLAIRGTAQAGLANVFLGSRNISGGLNFDLRLNGPFALASLSGPVTLSQGQLADPSLPFTLNGIAARANLAQSRAAIGATMAVSTGGAIAVQGTVGLTAPFDGDLTVDLQSVTLRDPELYQARLQGQIRMKGPMTGGAMISGNIALADTELRVPSSGFGGAANLPGLQHANEPADVRATRERAGMIEKPGDQTRGGPVFGLDVTVTAPSQLYVRGRGLDAELGGSLRISGTTANVVPIGSFSLIRGRLEILGKRLDLTEALLQLEGELVPYLRIKATTVNDSVTAGVLIEGPASAPIVSFTSTPELPEGEILAQLLFGQGLQNLSALQAVQLANAVATLAGKGGDGVIAKLRQGAGLDNLDVKTDSAGGASVTAGKYISEKIYTEVTVDQDGKSQIDLNLDVSKTVTLRARAASDGRTSLGVVVEKDY